MERNKDPTEKERHVQATNNGRPDSKWDVKVGKVKTQIHAKTVGQSCQSCNNLNAEALHRAINFVEVVGVAITL